jgi:hypothetical protein
MGGAFVIQIPWVVDWTNSALVPVKARPFIVVITEVARHSCLVLFRV